jgi:hypothetical protein
LSNNNNISDLVKTSNEKKENNSIKLLSSLLSKDNSNENGSDKSSDKVVSNFLSNEKGKFILNKFSYKYIYI